MAEPVEYTYDEPDAHLSEREALDGYLKAKRDHAADALVVLQSLDCGHWSLKTYETPEEKNAFLRKRLTSMVQNFWSALRVSAKTP